MSVPLPDHDQALAGVAVAVRRQRQVVEGHLPPVFVPVMASSVLLKLLLFELRLRLLIDQRAGDVVERGDHAVGAGDGAARATCRSTSIVPVL